MQIKNFDLRHFFRKDTMGGAGYTIHDLAQTEAEQDTNKIVRLLTEPNAPIYAMKLFNPLQTKGRPLYLKTQSVPRCKHFSSRL
jgi:hypothetical protein